MEKSVTVEKVKALKKERVGKYIDSSVQGWFLTYAQCDLTPRELLDGLERLPLPAITEYIVARELHKDGNPHLHAFLKFAKKLTFLEDRFDVDGYHPHIQVSKSWVAVQKYVTKGGDYIASFDPDAARSKKKARNLQLANEDPIKLVEEGIINFLQIDALMKNKAVYNSLKCVPLPRCSGFIPNTLGHLLPLREEEKLRHYWFWSVSANKGKTTFLQSLTKLYPCYQYNRSETYQDPKETDQFVLLDEYSERVLPASLLNMICDGTYRYPRKQLNPIQLNRPTVIICGNTDPALLYSLELNLIKARFVFINLD